MIVMDDADMDKAVAGALRGRFYNAGQTCTAVKRLYVHDRIAGEFVQKLKARISALNVGNGLGPKTDIGPLNSAEQRQIITDVIDRTRVTGSGTILTGGGVLRGKAYEAGYFYHPTLVTDVAPDSSLVTEELFGPVLPVMTFPDLDAAVRMANSSRYSLGASVWTKNLHTAKRVFDEVQAGIIWVNRHLTVPPEVPFGGSRESGIGRENGYPCNRTVFPEQNTVSRVVKKVSCFFPVYVRFFRPTRMAIAPRAIRPGTGDRCVVGVVWGGALLSGRWW